MKKLSLSLIFSLVSITFCLAQKSKVNAAYNYFKEPYKQYDKAVEAIDEACANEQTSGWAKTWYYKGLIYMSLFESETFGSLCNNCLITSYDAFMKAIELDPKNEWVDEINALRTPYISYHVFSTGIQNFKNGKFNEALTAFEMSYKISPEDTSALLNAAYSADQAGQKEKAITYYQKLVDIKYSDDNLFLSYANLLKKNNEMDKALGVLREGRKMYPDSLNLMLSEINTLLSTGRNEEASKALDLAINKDPRNQNLYLALGSTYDNLANPRDEAGKEMTKPSNAKELLQKAEQAYIKGLEINPNNYELNYNLGAMYFNQGAEMANATNSIKDMKIYEAEKKKYEDKFRQAQPHLQKAMEQNPKLTQDDKNIFQGTITSLKELYVRINEMEKYEQIKKMSEK